MFGINHIVSINSFGAGSHFNHLGKVLYQCRELFTANFLGPGGDSEHRTVVGKLALCLLPER